MDIIFRYNEYGLEVVRISYQEWVQLPEPPIFSFIGDLHENYWEFLFNDRALAGYAGLLTLLKIDSTLYKLNGKQRKELWNSGRIAPPDEIIGLVLSVPQTQFANLNEKITLSQNKNLSYPDLFKAAYTFHNLVFSSERIKTGFLYEAFNLALQGNLRLPQKKTVPSDEDAIKIIKTVGLFKEELMLLDSININPKIFLSGVLAGSLILLGQGKDIKSFIVALNQGKGSEKNEMYDPVSLVLKRAASFNTKKSATGYQTARKHLNLDLCSLFIQAALAWAEGENSPNYWRRRLSKGVDFTPYVRSLRQYKGLDENWDL